MKFSEIANQKLAAKKMKPSELARQMGYSPQYILDLLQGHRRWNETTMSRACEALGLRAVFIDKEAPGEKPGAPAAKNILVGKEIKSCANEQNC